MELVIRVSRDEFNERLFAKIKSLLKSSGETEVVIRIGNPPVDNILQEDAAIYLTKVNQSIKEIEEGKGVVFTMEELDEYINKNFLE